MHNVIVSHTRIVSQRTIESLHREQRSIKNASARLTALKTRYESRETHVIAKIKGGAHVSPGALLLAIGQDARRNVAWRSEFERMCGKDEAERIVQETEPTLTEYLVISRR